MLFVTFHADQLSDEGIGTGYLAWEGVRGELVGLQRVHDGSAPGCALGVAQAVVARGCGADVDKLGPLHIRADRPQGAGGPLNGIQ